LLWAELNIPLGDRAYSVVGCVMRQINNHISPWCVVIPRAGGRSDGDESSRACMRSICYARLPSVGGRTPTYALLLLLSWLWSSICMWLTLAFLPQCMALWGNYMDVSHRPTGVQEHGFSRTGGMSPHRVSLVKL
jgi:hypothetical protein